MNSMSVDPIQTQREVWLRARIQLAEREKEEEEGCQRLRKAVDVARERTEAEERALDELIIAAKAKFDDYKKLPQSEISAEAARAVEEGRVFDGAAETETDRLVPRRPVAIENGATAEGAI